MGVRVSGGSFSALGVGPNWERTDGDEAVARAVIVSWKTDGSSSEIVTLRMKRTASRPRWIAVSS